MIPEKAEIHSWPWIPAFAGMTTSEHGNGLLEFCDTLWSVRTRALRQPLKAWSYFEGFQGISEGVFIEIQFYLIKTIQINQQVKAFSIFCQKLLTFRVMTANNHEPEKQL